MTSTLKNWPIFSLLKPEFTSKIRMVVVFGNLGNSCLIVTKDQMVYGLGYNYQGCLGTGDRENSLCPMKIDKLCGENIKTFAYGQGHVLALTENGEVYAWGSNDYSQLGYSSGGTVPKKVQITEDKTNFVVDIACGAYYSLALTNNGMVYAWGCSENGQTASRSTHGQNCHLVKPVTLSEESLNSKKIVSISCGHSHSVAVTDSGQVYSWGVNTEGQLGNGCWSNSHSPCQVKNLTQIAIVKVVCGFNHTLALSNEGSLYSWGDNTFGQLGVILGSVNSSSKPVALSNLNQILDIAASNSSNISVAVQAGHQIFMWGKCLGQSITLPTLISVDSIHDAFAFYALPSIMHKPFVIDNEEEKEKDDNDNGETMSIMDHLKAAFDDTNTSDLTIEVEGKPIYVHKTILKIRSEYFKIMFQGAWKENNDSVVKEGQFSYVVYRAFLKFLYTGKIDIPAENAVELLKLADFYNDDNLKASCVDVIIEDITTANAAFLYSEAMKYNAMVLKDFCIKFAVKNMTHIVESTSFAEMSQEAMKTFIIEANTLGVFKM